VNAGSSEGFVGRLIQDGAHDGTFNMAADLYLTDWARRTGQLALRLYSWERPTLSLGYHQRISDELLEQCRHSAIPVVRRPTGGRAVLHDRELTYALALPTAHALLKDGRENLLRLIGEVFVAAAAKLELKAELVRSASQRPGDIQPLRRGSPLCFDSAARWEVRLQGCKWIGSAQRLLPGAFLQHGSIRLTDREKNEEFQPGENSLRIDPARLRFALAQSFEYALHVAWQEKGWTEFEVNQINSQLNMPECDLPKMAS